MDDAMFSNDSGINSHADFLRNMPASVLLYINVPRSSPSEAYTGSTIAAITSENVSAFSICFCMLALSFSAYACDSVGIMTNASEPTTVIGRYKSGSDIPTHEPYMYMDWSVLSPLDISKNGTAIAIT